MTKKTLLSIVSRSSEWALVAVVWALIADATLIRQVRITCQPNHTQPLLAIRLQWLHSNSSQDNCQPLAVLYDASQSNEGTVPLMGLPLS